MLFAHCTQLVSLLTTTRFTRMTTLTPFDLYEIEPSKDEDQTLEDRIELFDSRGNGIFDCFSKINTDILYNIILANIEVEGGEFAEKCKCGGKLEKRRIQNRCADEAETVVAQCTKCGQKKKV